MRDRLFIGFGICIAAVTIVQSTWAQITLVAGIEVQRRTDGVEVRLETSGTGRLYVSPSLTRHSLNSFVVDIPNAQLRLPNRETFRIENPVAGITLMTITPLDENSIRIEVRDARQMPNVVLAQTDCVENTPCKRRLVLFLAGPTIDEEQDE